MHPASAPNSTVRPAINSIFDFSAEALGQLRTWLEQNPPAIPITQVLGFAGFTVQAATAVTTQESTTSITYADLATVGPQLTNLPDGHYVVFFGAMATTNTNGGNNGARVSIQANSTAATDADSTGMGGGAAQVGLNVPLSRVTVATLASGGSNSITVKYRALTAPETATFQNRWMVAIKYANT